MITYYHRYHRRLWPFEVVCTRGSAHFPIINWIRPYGFFGDRPTLCVGRKAFHQGRTDTASQNRLVYPFILLPHVLHQLIRSGPIKYI
ncbi:hypothetical protein E4T56_gene6776 [Termitomyces sp. T112]|nr:hypothetical protein E4T56_gene6776 [Termitomyces sp. T112]